MILRISLTHFAVTAAIALLVALFAASHNTASMVLSVFAGGAVTGFAFVVLVWAGLQIFRKKSIALAGSVIVFKYAILVGIIYRLLSQDWVSLPGLAAGLFTLFPTVGFFAVQYKTLGEANGAL